MKLVIVAGARPNFIKIAPLIRAIREAAAAGKAIGFKLIHTGQHYDASLSGSFFQDLGIPEPDLNLRAGSGTQAEQTAAIIVPFEKELMADRPDCVVVVGDVTSTLACSIVAKKLDIDLVHVEAGIRSGDRTMPEEINRIVTDSITDYFFTTTTWASENLRQTGVRQDRIFWVGNTMIDSLVANRSRFSAPAILGRHNIRLGEYLVLTLHRPSNVDNEATLRDILSTIAETAGSTPVLFPVHPRTRKVLEVIKCPASLVVCEPMRYLEFMYLVEHALGVITDSGGIQEETTFLQKPCVTLRTTTERPETAEIGTNVLVGNDRSALRAAMEKLVARNWKMGRIPEKWDGNSAGRIVEKLVEIYA